MHKFFHRLRMDGKVYGGDVTKVWKD